MKTAEQILKKHGIDIGDIVCYSTPNGIGTPIDFDPIEMMNEIAEKAYNQAIKDAAINVRAKYCSDDNMFPEMRMCGIDEQSILKLKK